MGKPAFTIPVSYVYPGAWARLKGKFLLIADQWRAVSLRERLSTLLSTLAFGALLTVVSFSYLQRSRKQAARLKSDTPAKGGESAEDAFALKVLSRAGYGSLILMIGWLAVLVWIVDDNPPLDLVLPIVGFGAIFGTTWLLHVVMPRLPKLWTRDMRSLWGAYEAMAVYALGAAMVLAAMPLLVYALREYRAWTGLTGIVWLVLARLLTLRNAPDVKKRPISARVLHVLLAVAIGMGLLLTVVTICTFAVPDAHTPGMWRYTGVGFLCAASALLLLGVIGDANRLSPHPFYQDRLAETYLSTDRTRPRSTSLELLRDSSEWLLKDLHGQQARTDGIPGLNDPPTSAPLQIISCAINLAGSRDLTRKDRKSGYFTFTKYYSGSRHTGYRRTAEYIGGQMKIARAVTISGAAASSGIGHGTFFAQAFATVLFNLRLGAWLPNPSKAASIRASGVGRAHFWPKWLWREITMGTDERHSLVNLSDGGHTGDNVGIYPLLQRRCKLIIACDAECDPSLAFGSFTEAIRHAYVDLGIDVDIDLTMLRPDRDTGMSRSHCAVGLIRYPFDKNGQRPVGHLVYLKNSLTGDEPEPVLNYKSSNPHFPHETTADQFFDDAQFESYRSLGVHITEHAFGEWVTSGEYKKWGRMAARRTKRQVPGPADREGVVHA